MEKWKREIIYGVIIFAFCVASYIYAGTFSQFVVDIPLARPEAYLRMWLIAFGFLAVLKIITAYRKKDRQIAKPIFKMVPVLITLIFAIYLFIMPYLGFFWSTLLFMSASVILINFNMGKNIPMGKPFTWELAKCLAFSLVTTIVVEQIFRSVLSVRLPMFTLF